MNGQLLRALLFLLLASGTLLAVGCGSNASTIYGESFAAPGGDLPEVGEVMADTTMHNREIVLTGTIMDVCQKKGCWIVVSDGTDQMRVTFKDYGFFLPKDASNREVVIRGVVSVETLDEGTAKHYAEESKGEDPDAIEGPQVVVTMVASGVMLEDA